MEGDHDVTHRKAEDGDQDIGHILIHKSMKRLYPAETILVDERHFCFVRAVVNDTLNGVRKWKSAPCHDPYVIHECIDLLIHIESAVAARNLRYRKHFIPIKASFLKIFRDCHYIIDFPIEHTVLDNGRVVGKIHQRMIVA